MLLMAVLLLRLWESFEGGAEGEVGRGDGGRGNGGQVGGMGGGEVGGMG